MSELQANLGGTEMETALISTFALAGDAAGDVLIPLDEPAVEELARTMLKQRVEAVAVCLLHAYANPAHERRIGEIVRRAMPGRLAPTPTLAIHDFPGDYYRFSPQAMREVLLDGLDEREVEELMLPPRLIGSGRRPAR